MSDRTNIRRKKADTTIANPSLVSSSTPTLVNSNHSLALQSNTTLPEISVQALSNQQGTQFNNERLLEGEAFKQEPLGHDISRISLRPQSKLSTGQSSDPFDPEANWVADRIMRMPEPGNFADQMPETRFRGHDLSQPSSVSQSQGHDLRKISMLPVRAKLTVSQSGDPYEQEADRVANEVMRMQIPESNEAVAMRSLRDTIHRKYTVCEREELLQPKSTIQRSGDGTLQVEGDIESRLNSSKGGGNPLPDEVRSFMEPRFGSDFSGVQVHTDSNAVQMNRQLNAQAFAHRNDIYFGAGKTPGNNELTAHELTHVVQQVGKVQAKIDGSSGNPVDPPQSKDDKPQVPPTDLAEPPKTSKVLQVDPQDKTETGESKGQVIKKQGAIADTPPADGNGTTPDAPPVDKGGKPTGNSSTAQNKDNPQQQAQGDKQGKPEPGDPQANVGIAAGQPQEQAPGELPGADGSDKAVASDGKKAPASPEDDLAFQAVINNTKVVAANQKKHAPANSKAQEAQGAAEPPGNEVDSKAQANHVGEMGQAETPGFDAAAFKAKLMERIADMAPKTLEEADDFKNNNKLDSVKSDLSGKVKEEQKTSQSQLEEKTKEKPDTSGIEAKQVTPLPGNDPGAPPTGVNANQAAPKSKGQAEVEAPLQAESQKLDQQMKEADITEEQLANSNEPEFQGALAAKKDAQTNAQAAPPQYRQQEQGILATAQATAEATAQQHLQAMHGIRTQNLNQVGEHQVGAKGKDEQARAKVAGDINQIYEATKAKVEKTLSELDGQVIQAFDAGVAEAKIAFEDYVGKRMDKYKSDRYSGTLGAEKWLKDKLFGMPSEVNAFYQEGRQLYIQQMDGVINNVVAIISKELTQAKAEIANGKQEIQNYVNQLPQDLKGVGQQVAADINSKFEELQQSVDDKQNELIDTLAQKYKENLDAVDARIEEIKAANKGLVQQAFDAVVGVIKTIIELGKMLLQVLARVASVVGQILKDPIGFLGNLIQAVKQGFLNFMKNIGKYLEQGLIDWLTGTMAATGIQMPENFDLKGIFNLAMQLLGFTYEAIRAQAVNLLGEEKVSWIEKTVEIFKILASEGLAGIWHFVQDKMGDLNALVIEPIKNFIIDKVVTAGIEWVLSLLTPASAFIKAAQGIYEIVKFFMERAQQIGDLINTILDSMSAIAGGAIGQAVQAVESALAKSLPVVISFLASLLGLDGIAEKIQAIFQKLHKPMETAVNWIIDKGAKAFKFIGNKFNNSKFGKKFHSVKDAAKEKYKAGKQWVEDKKEAGQQWVENKKKSVKDKFGKFGFGEDKQKGKKDQNSKDNTSQDQRTHEVKKKDLEAAREKMQGIISKSESTKQVEQHFPAIQKDFGLKKLEWEELGTPSASVIMEVNPKAIIKLSGSDLILNEGDTTPSNKFKQEVTFETGNIDSKYLVGKKMEATKLGPNHPQGSSPLGGALNPLMKKLETDPSLGNHEKYIKGHLLNDNLGGPGSAQNLYPITADANSKHVRQVESVVKNWVNAEGYWVYYKVEVANEKVDLVNGVINADFVCEAAKLDVDGKKSFKGAIKTTIHSELGEKRKVTQNEIKKDEFSEKDAIKDPSFDPKKVEVSSTKKRKRGEMEEELEASSSTDSKKVEVSSTKKQKISEMEEEED